MEKYWAVPPIPGRGGRSICQTFLPYATDPSTSARTRASGIPCRILPGFRGTGPVLGRCMPSGDTGKCCEVPLPHGYSLMYQLSLKGGGPCPTSRPGTMEAIVAFDRRGHPRVDDTACGLLQDLY